ncbi:hypothetical protein WN944_000098 [Citrus x changshan-huyou]|uniref:Uncharacterized protein n=1 Tax=Citrus x changshan-huyou TaxID=2935761 RepID=A0AAP0MGK3_9ROSI
MMSHSIILEDKNEFKIRCIKVSVMVTVQLSPKQVDLFPHSEEEMEGIVGPMALMKDSDGKEEAKTSIHLLYPVQRETPANHHHEAGGQKPSSHMARWNQHHQHSLQLALNSNDTHPPLLDIEIELQHPQMPLAIKYL